VRSEALNILTNAIFSSLEMVKVLIDLSPTLNVNCTNKAGWTPLHFAAQYKNLEVRILS
jgi:ankyrin repeat protein